MGKPAKEQIKESSSEEDVDISSDSSSGSEEDDSDDSDFESESAEDDDEKKRKPTESHLKGLVMYYTLGPRHDHSVQLSTSPTRIPHANPASTWVLECPSTSLSLVAAASSSAYSDVERPKDPATDVLPDF